MNGLRNSRRVDVPTLTTKICGTCKEYKMASQFFKQRRCHDGLDTICKSCFADVDYKRNQTNDRRVMRRKAQQKRRQELKLLWCQYFTNTYGTNPTCQVCNESLEWFGETQVWDHRGGGSELIRSPGRWLTTHRPNKDNVSKWNICNFGLVCGRCNQFMPTANRLQWVQNVTRYVKESLACE